MERIELARGRWLAFARPMYVSDRRAISEAAESMGDDGTLLDLMARILAAIEPAVAERSWDGPLDQVTVEEINDLTRAWATQTEDDALPLADGTSSGTPSPDVG